MKTLSIFTLALGLLGALSCHREQPTLQGASEASINVNDISEVSLTLYPQPGTLKKRYTKVTFLKDGTAIKRELGEKKSFQGSLNSEQFSAIAHAFGEAGFFSAKDSQSSSPTMEASAVVDSVRKKIAIGKDSPAKLGLLVGVIESAINKVEWSPL